MLGRKMLINYLVRKLVKPVSEEEVLLRAGKDYLLNSRKLPPEEVSTLQDEARAFRESLMWKLMKNELEYVAFRHITDMARTPEDILWGKAVFYASNLHQKFLDKLAL